MAKWKKIVGSVAPALATALGGPLAGAAVRTIATQVLGKPNASESDVEAAVLAGDPQMLLQLRQIDYEFRKTMIDAGIDLERIAAADRDSARRREVDTKDITPRILAYTIIGATLLFEGVALLIGFPKDSSVDPVIIGRILGTLDTLSAAVVMYYFGSSAGSQNKDATISEIAKME